MTMNDIAKPYLVPGAARTATGLKGQVVDAGPKLTHAADFS
jgi:hypothetical protein